ncbi:MAG: hypothetical protein U9R25_07325 [Chloroflexota bacterium]|nr:hypothetical protein [Chloroflexota bacterium]
MKKRLICEMTLALLVSIQPATIEALSIVDQHRASRVKPGNTHAIAAGSDVGETGGDVNAIVVGDLDNDGDMDMVSGDASGFVTTWQNNNSPFGGLWLSNVVGHAEDAVYALALANPMWKIQRAASSVSTRLVN